jgi:hypothetical protein
VALPGVQTDLRITRHEFEAMVRPALDDTLAALRRVMRSAGVEPAQLASVVLVGGSSRIPLAADLIRAELGVPIALDAHPKHAVALGAARLPTAAAAPVSVGAPTPSRRRDTATAAGTTAASTLTTAAPTPVATVPATPGTTPVASPPLVEPAPPARSRLSVRDLAIVGVLMAVIAAGVILGARALRDDPAPIIALRPGTRNVQLQDYPSVAQLDSESRAVIAGLAGLKDDAGAWAAKCGEFDASLASSGRPGEVADELDQRGTPPEYGTFTAAWFSFWQTCADATTAQEIVDAYAVVEDARDKVLALPGTTNPTDETSATS